MEWMRCIHRNGECGFGQKSIRLYNAVLFMHWNAWRNWFKKFLKFACITGCQREWKKKIGELGMQWRQSCSVIFRDALCIRMHTVRKQIKHFHYVRWEIVIMEALFCRWILFIFDIPHAFDFRPLLMHFFETFLPLTNALTTQTNGNGLLKRTYLHIYPQFQIVELPLYQYSNHKSHTEW